MEQERIAAALLSAPGWARVGLTVPDDKLRQQAARELAECIADGLNQPLFIKDRDQLPLPL